MGHRHQSGKDDTSGDASATELMTSERRKRTGMDCTGCSLALVSCVTRTSATRSKHGSTRNTDAKHCPPKHCPRNIARETLPSQTPPSAKWNTCHDCRSRASATSGTRTTSVACHARATRHKWHTCHECTCHARATSVTLATSAHVTHAPRATSATPHARARDTATTVRPTRHGVCECVGFPVRGGGVCSFA
jgi:hypothetical protein